MIRVLLLRSSCGLYGADRALLDLASALPLPFEPVVGSVVRGGADELGEEAARRGLPTWRIQSDGRADYGAARALARRLVEQEVSLLHAHDYKSLALATLAGRAARVPVVVTYHGDTAATLALRAYETLGRALGNLTRGAAAVSEPLRRRVQRWMPGREVLHIPNGIRLPAPMTHEERAAAREALGIPPGATVVAALGRLSVEKGHTFLLRALKDVPQRPVLVCAGDGPLAAQLQAQARGLDARFTGFVRDTRQLYAAADLVALPSLTEGLPLVALEAMALGVPLVASAVGELPALLGEDAGLLVRPGDQKALGRALIALCTDPPLRRRLAQAAAARVRRGYSPEQLAGRYARRLYAPALADDRQGARAWALRTAQEVPP